MNIPTKLQDIQTELPLKIALIAFLSPKHLTLSNPLAIETLQGDLIGFYGKQVKVELFQVREKQSIKAVLINLASFRPGLIGLSIQPGSLESLDAFFNAISQDSYLHSVLYLLGNQLPTYFPSQFLLRYQKNNVVIVKGEGELPLRSIVKEMLTGDIFFTTIPNIVYRDSSGAIVHSSIKKTNLAELIYPPTPYFLEEVAANEGFALMETSRGCSYGGCVYCTRTSFRFGGKWEPFPVKRILTQVSNIVNSGIQRIEFVDDEFFGGRDSGHLQRAFTLAEGIATIQQEKDAQIAFGIMTTPNILYRPDDPKGNTRIEEVLQLLHNAGLVKIYWGVEALSFSQLVRYGRKVWMRTQADVENQYESVIQLLLRNRIESEIGFAMLDPFISFRELQENLDVFERLHLFHHNMWPFRPLVVNEGALLAEKLRASGQLGKVDINFMCYRCEFQDPLVSAIIRAIREVDLRLPNLMPLVYRVRTISRKRFPGQPKTEQIELAERFVNTNAFAYLNLIKKCCVCLEDIRPQDIENSDVIQHLDNIVNETVDRLSRMIEDIQETLRNEHFTFIGQIVE